MRDAQARNRRRNIRRLAAGAFATLGLVGLGVGSASQLPLGSSAVAAGTTVLAAPCHGSGAVQATFTSTYDVATARYRATGVTVTGINGACNGRTFKLRVVTGSTSIGDLTGQVANGTATASFPATAVDTITNVAVAIP